MTDDALLTIGRFARLSGLSVYTLRHYDDIGLLSPATIDPTSGYRRYHRSQVQTARLIQALRWIDLPLDQVRIILQDPVGDPARATLAAHRDRLSRQASLLAARIADVEYYIEKGISMAPISGTHPVQLKIAVDDVDAAIAFYQQAFGFHYDVTRRTEEGDYSSFIFSKYGERDFFLLHLIADPAQSDRPGPTTFGLLVEDLADSHKRALAAGTTEMCPPHNAEGMPRCSAVRDPDGNWIWLYQG